jgi:hypothetical protein
LVMQQFSLTEEDAIHLIFWMYASGELIAEACQ